MTTASFPTSIKNFGADSIDGEYIHASHINELRAEVNAIETTLGTGLSNTLSAGVFSAKGDLLAGTASGSFSAHHSGSNGSLLAADSTSSSGLRWATPSELRLPRCTSYTSDAILAVYISTTDQLAVTAQAVDMTVAAPIGTPSDGQKLLFRIKDNGTSRAIGWHSTFRGIGVSLPSATTAAKTLYLGFIYNAADARWDCIAQAQEA